MTLDGCGVFQERTRRRSKQTLHRSQCKRKASTKAEVNMNEKKEAKLVHMFKHPSTLTAKRLIRNIPDGDKEKLQTSVVWTEIIASADEMFARKKIQLELNFDVYVDSDPFWACNYTDRVPMTKDTLFWVHERNQQRELHKTTGAELEPLHEFKERKINQALHGYRAFCEVRTHGSYADDCL